MAAVDGPGMSGCVHGRIFARKGWWLDLGFVCGIRQEEL